MRTVPPRNLFRTARARKSFYSVSFCAPQIRRLALNNASSFSETKDMEGVAIQRDYCPIDGKYAVKYKINSRNGKEECKGSESTLDSCPTGSVMNIHFRNCNFQNTGRFCGCKTGALKSTEDICFRNNIGMSWTLGRFQWRNVSRTYR